MGAYLLFVKWTIRPLLSSRQHGHWTMDWPENWNNFCDQNHQTFIYASSKTMPFWHFGITHISLKRLNLGQWQAFKIYYITTCNYLKIAFDFIDTIFNFPFLLWSTAINLQSFYLIEPFSFFSFIDRISHWFIVIKFNTLFAIMLSMTVCHNSITIILMKLSHWNESSLKN